MAQAASKRPFPAPSRLWGALGTFLVLAYNLELFGGRFHNDIWFAVAWGGFPAFTGYFTNALTVRPAGVLVSTFSATAITWPPAASILSHSSSKWRTLREARER